MAEGISLWECIPWMSSVWGLETPGLSQGVWKGVLVKLAFTHLHHPPLTASIDSCALQLKPLVSKKRFLASPLPILYLLDTITSRETGI